VEAGAAMDMFGKPYHPSCRERKQQLTTVGLGNIGRIGIEQDQCPAVGMDTTGRQEIPRLAT